MIVFRFILWLTLVSNTITDKLLIHEHNYTVALVLVCIIPFLAYLIQYFIPAKFTLYSKSTIEQLDRYEFQLTLLKDKY